MEGKETRDINVLLIDDDEDEYVVARDIFSEIGNHYKVHWINDFDKGLEEVIKSGYDICLLDYHLGIYNGIDFIKEAVLRTCKIPIIILTGQGSHEIDFAAMKAGATDYLDKNNLDANILERTVRYAIERKKSEEIIRFLAFYDQLTHLPNRTLFFDRLHTAIASAKRYKRICAVMFLDIDNFKRINDSLGHNIGDMLIKEVAKRLLKCIRKEDIVVRDRFDSMLDTVARLGGDEFTILLSEIKEPENAAKAAERIHNVLLSPVLLEDKEINVTVSIGIAIYPSDGDDIETVIKNADLAMYNAKSIDKNNFQYYNSSMNTPALQRLNLESDLRKALENKELLMYYQPLIDLKTRKIKGVEALLRWQHPQKGIILPMDFIPLAEETGLIFNISNCVFNIVGTHYDKWHNNGLDEIDVSINISPKQLNQKNFLDTVIHFINDFKISPHHLTFEITENSIINNVEKANKIIDSLRALGIKISMDDFGSGYSSFFTLRQFSFDILKIDRSLIKNIPYNIGDTTIVASLISIGHSMNLQVIAEGIEREDQLLFLASKECDVGQGYYFSVPVPEENLLKMMEK